MALVVALKVKLIAKSLDISNENEITSRPFIIVGSDGLLRILLVIFQNLLELSLVFNFGLHVAALCIFQNFIAPIAGSSKCGKSSATVFPLIVIVAVVTVNYGSSTFRRWL